MKTKKIILFFLFTLIFLGIFFRIVSLNNEFIGEETDFVMPAIAIMQTGFPQFYHSEQQPNAIALWHPPMYIYFMGVLFYLFGVNEITARSINIVFSILISFVIFMFCKEFIGKEKGKIIGLISSAFFLFNYYIFSSSVIIDIDVFSAFFMFLFVYSILSYSKTKEKKFVFLAIISLFFGLWNRFPMAGLIYFFVGTYYIINKDLRKDFKEYFLIGMISVSGFILSWSIYSLLTRPEKIFSFLEHNTRFGISQISDPYVYIGSFFINISQFVRLFTFPATILLIISLIYFLNRKEKVIRILLIYSLSILIFFFILPRPAFGYPRYFMTAFPGIAIILSLFFYENLKDYSLEKKVIFTLAGVFLVSLMMLIILDPIPALYTGDGLIKATNFYYFLLNFFCSLPLISILLFKTDRKKILILMLIALAISYSLFFNIQYLLYEPNIKETANYLKENISEDEKIIVPKAIGYYSGEKFYINENNKPKISLSFSGIIEYIEKSMKNPKMDEEFFWSSDLSGGLYDPQPRKSELERVSYVVTYHKINSINYEKKIGNFYIYNTRQLII